jgi:hypothetical protein
MDRMRARSGRFKAGIHDENFDSALAWATGFGFPQGPFAVAVDDTKIVAAISTYRDGEEWIAAGMHGGVQTFTSYDELAELGKSLERTDLADKVSLPLKQLFVDME